MAGMGATTTAPWSPVYPPALATPITHETLAAIRALTAWVLQRERATQAGSAPPPAPEALRQQLATLPLATLLQGIQRHRLESLLQADAAVGDLIPQLQIDLQRAARREGMAALALASLTREMAMLFAAARIPLLVIKGIPLALQTTGTLTARGRGDLDLLVQTERLTDAVELLESAGFARLPGHCPHDLRSFWGRYSRWAGYELPLMRVAAQGPQSIDLHWSLSNVRSPLPNFEEAWRCRSVVQISGQDVATLSLLHCFQHACAHAAKDQWMCLRNLIDIERLAHQLSRAELTSLSHLPIVHQSCAAAYLATAFDGLKCAALPHQPGATLALRRASRNQRLPWRSQVTADWSLGQWASLVGRQLALSYAAGDWIRTLLYFLILPAAFSDPVSGKDRGLREFLSARLSHLRKRFLESASGNPVPSGAWPATHSIPAGPASRSDSVRHAGKESRSR